MGGKVLQWGVRQAGFFLCEKNFFFNFVNLWSFFFKFCELVAFLALETMVIYFDSHSLLLTLPRW